MTANVWATQQVVLYPFYIKYKLSEYFIVLKVLTLKHSLINSEIFDLINLPLKSQH
jgi:hypothetical protein